MRLNAAAQRDQGRPRSTRASNKDVPACDQLGFQQLSVNKPPTIAVDDVKALLRRFTAERQQWRPDAAALELGDLILCLMQQADRLGIDLVSAGEARLQSAVTNVRAAGSAAPRRGLALVRSAAATAAATSAQTPAATSAATCAQISVEPRERH